jgi:DNA polymerase I-like protein with 3'-5' exonuclease and polymerase domains
LNVINDATLEEADHIIQSLYNSFPQLRRYVEIQGQYPLDNNGYIKTMLGDKLRLREFYDYLPKATNDRERNNLIARIKRLGVNLPIQGGTSSIMACGFFNNIRVSKEQGWKTPLQPIIVVH